MSHEGKIVAIEGTDGVGKSTQIESLSRYLIDQDYDVLSLTAPSDLYRNDPFVIQYNQTGNSLLRVDTLAMMSASDRMRAYDTKIQPHIEAGGVVICDRYKFSAEAYFKMRGANVDLLKKVHENLPDPDYAVLLTLDATARLARLRSRATTEDWEEQNMAYLDDVQSVLMSSWKDRYAIIDASKTEESISQDIQQYLELNTEP